MQSGPNCKKLVEGSAPKPLKTRTAFCGCSVFLHQMCFRQWAEMKAAVMPGSCVLHAILAWRLSLFVKIATALALAGRGLGAEPTNKLLQKLLRNCRQIIVNDKTFGTFMQFYTPSVVESLAVFSLYGS